MYGPLRLQGGERDPTEPNLTTLPIKPHGMSVKPSWTLKTSAMQPLADQERVTPMTICRAEELPDLL